MKKFLIIFFLQINTLFGFDVSCSFEEVYGNGDVQQGQLFFKDQKLRYEYFDKNLFTIIAKNGNYFLIDQAFALSNEYFKKNQDRNKYFHLIGGGVTCWVIWQSSTFLGIILGEAIPEKLGLNFAVPLTFLALLVNDFRKVINVIVIIISGLVATFGYNLIPYKAYVIVAGLTGLCVAWILTNKIKKYE